MLDAVLIVTLGLHLLLVDVAMAGPLVCVWLEWRASRRDDAAAATVSRLLARWTQWALAGGIVLGVALLAARWWLDDRPYFTAVANVPRSRLWFAGMELLFFFACMGAYGALWDRGRNWRLAHRALAVAAATNLLIHFPALFVILSVVSTRADLLAGPLDASAYRQLLFDREVLSRIVHVWLSAWAVTGVAVMGLAMRLSRDDAAAAPLVRRAAQMTLLPTMIQIPIGLWVAMEMPEDARRPLLGGDVLATGLFVASIVLALALMHALTAIALGNNRPVEISRAIAGMLLLIVLMAGTRQRVGQQQRAPRANDAHPAVVAVLPVASKPAWPVAALQSHRSDFRVPTLLDAP